MMEVATARKRSTQFVFLRKKFRQSGKDIAKRSIISRAKMAVATLSVISRSALRPSSYILRSSLEAVVIDAVRKACMVRSAAMSAIQMIFVFSYHRCANDNGRSSGMITASASSFLLGNQQKEPKQTHTVADLT